MVMMKNSVILATCLLLLSSLALQTYADSHGPDECCFNFVNKRLPKKGVMNIRHTDPLCPMEGLILAMKNGKEYCADPSQQWVKDILKMHDKKQQKGVSNFNTTASQ